MARWTWTIATTAGAELAELTAATGRKINWKLEGGAAAGFSIDGRHALASEIDELASDVIVRRDGVKVFRGRVGATSDTLDADSHKLSVEVGDYRSVLARRIWTTTALTRTAVEQSEIAWTDLITHTQGLSGGNLGITRGIGAVTAALATRTINPGVSIGAEIDALSKADDPLATGAHPGFDWEIDADLAFNLYYPTRGTNRPDVVLEYGGAIATVQRQVAPGTYANAVRLSGGGLSTAVIQTAADIATRPEGRWDVQVGDTTLYTSAEVTAKVVGLLADYEALEPSYACTLRPGWWQGPTHLFLGDTVPVRIQSGRLNVVSNLRVTEVSVTLGESGEEVVGMTFGPPLRNLRDTLGGSDHRLATLERR